MVSKRNQVGQHHLVVIRSHFGTLKVTHPVRAECGVGQVSLLVRLHCFLPVAKGGVVLGQTQRLLCKYESLGVCFLEAVPRHFKQLLNGYKS